MIIYGYITLRPSKPDTPKQSQSVCWSKLSSCHFETKQWSSSFAEPKADQLTLCGGCWCQAWSKHTPLRMPVSFRPTPSSTDCSLILTTGKVLLSVTLKSGNVPYTRYWQITDCNIIFTTGEVLLLVIPKPGKCTVHAMLIHHKQHSAISYRRLRVLLWSSQSVVRCPSNAWQWCSTNAP